MCNHDHNHKPVGPHFGAALEHGEAHTKDHARWNRRDFLSTLGLAGASMCTVGTTPVRAMGFVPGMSPQAFSADRVLVLIQLKGGVDGLNVIIPVQDSEYYNKRPAISISQSNALSMDSQFSMHPSLQSIHPLWQANKMGVVHGVGYPDHSLSHFRSTDILMSSRPDASLATGWLGRYFDDTYPDFFTNPPAHPLAIEINPVPSRVFSGDGGQMGVSLRDPETFYRIASSGSLYDNSELPEGAYGEELAFVRGIANSSFHYSGVISDAANAAQNEVTYPISNILADQLAIVARMIKGGLNTRFYSVQLSSFDTHTGQDIRMVNLLTWLSEAVSTFYTDLEMGGVADKVVACSFSEFGRRVEQNGSFGTDHGTASPTILFGAPTSISPGFHGSMPSLTDLDFRGNMKHTTDFRSIYGTLLTEWMGVNCNVAKDVVGTDFETLDLIQSQASSDTCTALPVELDQFSARLDGSAVMLEWSTLSESGNQGFYVEQEGDGGFVEVDFVQAAGRVSGGQYSYQVADLFPGKTRFRLRQVDVSGASSYSRSIEVDVPVDTRLVMDGPFPMPVVDRATLKLVAQSDGHAEVELYDISGRLVKRLYSEVMQSGRAQLIRFNTIGLAAGSYVVVATSGKAKISKVIAVQR